MAETKAIKATTEEKVAEFLRENIFYKFGYPRELVTDQGIQLTSSMIEELLKHHKIKHRTSTPHHPQANGKVEVTNRALDNILTKVVNKNRKDWVERLVRPSGPIIRHGRPPLDLHPMSWSMVKRLCYTLNLNIIY